MILLAPGSRRWMNNPWFWGGLLLLWLVGLALAHGYDGLYGQDAYAHLNYARDIQALWRSGRPLGPYQWPRLYAFLGALWFWGDPAVWMQGLAMVAAAVLLAMVIKLLQAMLPEAKWMGALAFAFVGLSPLLVRNSLSVMADMPSLALMASGLWMGSQYLRRGKSLQLAAACVLTGGAIWLRYPAALAMFLPGLTWVWAAVRRRDFAGLGLTLPSLFVLGLPQLLLPQAVGEGLAQPFAHQHFVGWSPEHYFGRDFVQKDGQMHYPLPNLVVALGLFWHPRYLGLGLLGILGFLFRKRLHFPKVEWVAGGAILLNVLFLAGIPFQNPRFLLPALPFAALFLAGNWNALWERIFRTERLRTAAFVVVVAVQLALGIWSCGLLFRVNANERAVADALKALPQRGQRLYELSFEAMLRARGVPFEAVHLWDGPVPEPRVGDLVLFNLPAFEKQFAGMWPMKNWAFLQETHSLVKTITWKEGWALYEVH
jgi:hypothetical protein